ncbi:MAG TPA: transposase [Sphingobium sp.]|nr:transposase [Sphingobium sp.]
MSLEQVIDEGCCPQGGRRRRWSTDEKRAIVELSLDPECSVAEVASCFGVIPAQIYGWRRELRELEDVDDAEAPVFLPALIEPVPAPAQLLELERNDGRLLPDTMVQVAMRVRDVPVMVAHGANPMVVASVIAALKAAR